MLGTCRNILILLCFLGLWFPFNGDAGALENQEKTSVQKYRTIPEAEFLEVFNQYLCRRLGKDKSDIIVSRFRTTGNRQVPVGKISYQLYQESKGALEGFVRLAAMVRVPGMEAQKVKLAGWVDIFDQVVCTSRNLERGEEITEDDVYLARKNISRLSSEYVNDITKVTGYTVKHNIKTDTCLKTWMLIRTPIVDKGDFVTILAESGALRVAAPGMVLAKGYPGELIKVQNLMSNKEIYAKVVDDATVKVDF